MCFVKLPHIPRVCVRQLRGRDVKGIKECMRPTVCLCACVYLRAEAGGGAVLALVAAGQGLHLADGLHGDVVGQHGEQRRHVHDDGLLVGQLHRHVWDREDGGAVREGPSSGPHNKLLYPESHSKGSPLRGGLSTSHHSNLSLHFFAKNSTIIPQKLIDKISKFTNIIKYGA